MASGIRSTEFDFPAFIVARIIMKDRRISPAAHPPIKCFILFLLPRGFGLWGELMACVSVHARASIPSVHVLFFWAFTRHPQRTIPASLRLRRFRIWFPEYPRCVNRASGHKQDRPKVSTIPRSAGTVSHAFSPPLAGPDRAESAAVIFPIVARTPQLQGMIGEAPAQSR